MTILFYPDNITPKCRIYYALNDLGIKYHNNKNKYHDLIIYWSYHKTITIQDDFILQSKCLNKGCYDITKTRVANIFDNIIVNPEKYNGPVVRKTEKQGDDQETLIICPSQKEDEYIYRKFIDTKRNNYYIDYRIFYFKDRKFLVSKWKEHMFQEGGKYLWKEENINVIPEKKLKEIDNKCKKFGFDLGEIDLLQDNKNDVFYVIDINNTPGGRHQWVSSQLKTIREKFNKELNIFLRNYE